MFNGAQLHLAVNHMPVIGVLIGFFILFAGVILKNSSIRRTAMGVLIFAAVSVAPTYLSGEPAEEMVEHKPGVTKALIHEHEEAAELSLVFTAIVGAAAALSLVLGKLKRDSLETKSTYATLALSAVTFAMLANTAHLGGLIRHDELRVPGVISSEGVAPEANEKDDDD
jgi:hypothetical protein